MDDSRRGVTPLALELRRPIAPANGSTPRRTTPLRGKNAAMPGAGMHERPAALSLTFDDGPDPVWTPRVLAALAEAGARATFFVMARRAAGAPELVGAMRAAGHAVELHCLRHVRHRVAGRAAVARDTREALRLLGGLGVHPRGWRLPWGEAAPFSGAIAAAHGLTLCGWTLDTRDWRGDRAETMLAGVADEVRPGAVVLMHDGLDEP